MSASPGMRRVVLAYVTPPPRLVVPLLAALILGVGSSGGLVLARAGDRRPATPMLSAAAAAPAAPASRPPPMAPIPTPTSTPVTPTVPPSPVADGAHVAPLSRVLIPDLVVRVPGQVTHDQLAALRAITGVSAVTSVDVGTASLAGAPGQVWGVDPSEFRPWTPPPTAASDALWAGLARGDAVATFELTGARHLALGQPVPVMGPAGAVPLRLGAEAALGVPGVDLLVDRSRSGEFGLRPDGAVLVAAPAAGTASLKRAVMVVLGRGADVSILSQPKVTATRTVRRGQRPKTYRELYQAAAPTCRGLSWTVLAAIGQVESNHGRNAGVSSAGARGPMQFLPSTWAVSGVDGDGDGVADIDNPFDAVYSAAHYLCDAGIGRGTPQALHDAIFAYNHAEWYVQEVLALSQAYAARG